MNCAWCGSNGDNSGSHGICPDCFEAMALQSATRAYERVPSYVERFKHASDREEQEQVA